MSAFPRSTGAAPDTSGWDISPTCRMILDGQPFLLDGGAEMKIRYRIAGRRGLRSDLLALAPLHPHAGESGETRSIPVANLEAAIDAGMVSCLVDARLVQGGRARRQTFVHADERRPNERGREATTFPIHSRFSVPAEARAPTPPPYAARVRGRRKRFPDQLVASVVAAGLRRPAVTAAAIYARLRAEWPEGVGAPPSRSTVERWVRRARSAFLGRDDTPFVTRTPRSGFGGEYLRDDWS